MSDLAPYARAVKERAYRLQAPEVPIETEEAEEEDKPFFPPEPELAPGERHTDILERMKAEREAQDFSSYTGQVQVITQSGRAATQSLKRILEAKRAEAAAQAALATRNAQGQIITGNPRPSSVSGNAAANRALAQRMAASYGWTGMEWAALDDLIGNKESGWNNYAQNPSSSAFGIGQFLDGTWKTVGGSKTTNARLQIEYMLRYIQQRYGTPSNALSGYTNRYGPGRSGY